MCNQEEIDSIKEMINVYKQSLPKLKIIIFGPGEDNPDPYAQKCYRKRCQIKQTLEEDNDVFFFEDLQEEAERSGNFLGNTLVFETIISRENADCILTIFALKSSGLQGELCAFSQHEDLSRKMKVFYDSTYYNRDCRRHWQIDDALNLIDGFNGLTEPFTENDIDSCSLLTKAKKIIAKERNASALLPRKKYQEID